MKYAFPEKKKRKKSIKNIRDTEGLSPEMLHVTQCKTNNYQQLNNGKSG